MADNRTPPRLEVLSWIAGILSAVIAFIGFYRPPSDGRSPGGDQSVALQGEARASATKARIEKLPQAGASSDPEHRSVLSSPTVIPPLAAAATASSALPSGLGLGQEQGLPLQQAPAQRINLSLQAAERTEVAQTTKQPRRSTSPAPTQPTMASQDSLEGGETKTAQPPEDGAGDLEQFLFGRKPRQ